MKSVIVICLALSMGWILPVPSDAGDPVDNRIWARLLEAHVTDGRVDYDGFKRDEAELDRYLAILSDTDPDTLSRGARFAFSSTA